MCVDEREERIARNRERARELRAEIERRIAADPHQLAFEAAEEEWLRSYRAERGLK